MRTLPWRSPWRKLRKQEHDFDQEELLPYFSLNKAIEGVFLLSQLLKNWALEKDYLSRFARHYATDEPMPDALLSKLILAKNFQAAFVGLRQLSFAFLDMGWHLEPHSENAGIKEIEEEAVRTTLLMPLPQSTCISTSFAYIFSGSYASGYYSYKWAEVLDADAFSLFDDRNLFSQSIAEKFRQHILSSGGTEHPMDMFIRFMGRYPLSEETFRHPIGQGFNIPFG